jgi:hypothetical protein
LVNTGQDRKIIMSSKRFFGALKAAFVFGALTLVLFLPGSVLAAGTAVVTVVGPAQAVSPGQQFLININVNPNNAIAGAQFNLSFNSSLVTVDNVTEGNLLRQGGASTYFMPGHIDNAAGNVTAVSGVIISPGQTVSAAGTFAVVTMTAKSTAGTCPLNLSNVIVGNINGQAVPISIVNGQVTIHINQAPVLAAIGNKSVNEGQQLTFTISATDPNGDNLTYSASNLPTGASFNATTRTFAWMPTYSQSGTYPGVHFQVSDGSLTDFEDVTITVSELYPNWDPNTDGATNVLDLIVIGQRWGQTGTAGWIREDVNVDGTISVLDCIVVGQHWTG